MTGGTRRPIVEPTRSWTIAQGRPAPNEEDPNNRGEKHRDHRAGHSCGHSDGESHSFRRTHTERPPSARRGPFLLQTTSYGLMWTYPEIVPSTLQTSASAPVRNRSSGARASARWSTTSTAAGTSGRTEVIGATDSVNRHARARARLRPVGLRTTDIFPSCLYTRQNHEGICDKAGDLSVQGLPHARATANQIAK